MPNTPLQNEHIKHGAIFEDEGDWSMPGHYGDIAAEHEAIRHAAGLVDLSHRGKIRMKGNDRQSFLHRMVTNDINILQPGHGTYACMLTVQGKIISDMTVYVRNDELLFDAEPGMGQILLETLDKYALIDDVEMENITEQFGLIGVHGPQAVSLLNNVFGAFTGLELLHHETIEYQGIPLMVARSPRTGEEGYDIYVPADQSGIIWSSLHEQGAVPVGLKALDALRIEAGIPRCGADLDERIIPNEAIKERAVSFNKGCYIGQEPVVMLEHRGRPNKMLAGLKVDGDVLPAKDAALQKDGQDAGWLTSLTQGYSVDSIIALGFVRRKFNQEGERLTVEVNGKTVEAEIVTLPFYQG